MPDTRTYATAVAAVAGVGLITFVGAVAVIAANVAGLWAGVAVVGLSTAIAGFVGLYALGQTKDDTPRPR